MFLPPFLRGHARWSRSHFGLSQSTSCSYFLPFEVNCYATFYGYSPLFALFFSYHLIGVRSFVLRTWVQAHGGPWWSREHSGARWSLRKHIQGTNLQQKLGLSRSLNLLNLRRRDLFQYGAPEVPTRSLGTAFYSMLFLRRSRFSFCSPRRPSIAKNFCFVFVSVFIQALTSCVIILSIIQKANEVMDQHVLLESHHTCTSRESKQNLKFWGY